MTLEKGTIISGRYEIIEKIGMGGMAIVYRAKDKKLDRDVTFKVMREEHAADEEFLKRFNVEARAAASLSDHNIVNVYDVGEENNIHYIVMEYIDGATLKELINENAPFENAQTLNIAIQIASALSHAHSNNIIHRDIKPQNILVTNSGVIKVTDFGIARAVSASTTTMNNDTIGSVHYFSPEQARGKYVDVRSDIYSLGILMYEMATGELPFDGDSAVSIALKHINEEMPDMKAINPKISDSLNKIILKATNKLSSQRYDNIDEMMRDLEKAITNETGEFVKGSDLNSSTIKLNDSEVKAIRDNIDHKINNSSEREDYDYEDDEYYEDDRRLQKKVTIAAIFTVLALICLITALGMKEYSKRGVKDSTIPNLVGLTEDEAKEELRSKGVSGINFKISSDTKLDANDNVIISQEPEEGSKISRGDTIELTINKKEGEVEVPNVVGKKAHDAYKDFDNLSLDIGKNSEVYEYSDDYPAGTIVRQEPSGGEMVSKGTKVIFYVSKGEETKKVIVPDLVGLKLKDAKRSIKNSGLELGIINKSPSDKYEEGTISTQTILAGKEVIEGSKISIVVSTGKDDDDSDDIVANEIVNNDEDNVKTSKNNKKEKDNDKEKSETSNKEKTDKLEDEDKDKKDKMDKQTKNKISTKNITFNAPANILDDSELYSVKIVQTSSSGYKNIFTKDQMLYSDFPITVKVEGSGQSDIILYVNGIIATRESVDFSKE